MDYIYKLAETVELTMEIPESEKRFAAQSVLHFQKMVRKLDAFDKHLDVIYDPFKKYNIVSQNSIIENRAAIWNYLQKILDNFNILKDLATICVNDLSYFSTDPTMGDLEKSFINDFSDIETALVEIKDSMSNYELKDYKNVIVLNIENVKKKIDEIKKLIFDRIIDNINTNILTKNWVNKIDNKKEKSFIKSEPLISRLYKERENSLVSSV